MAIVNPIGPDFRVSSAGGRPWEFAESITTLGNGNFVVVFDAGRAGHDPGIFARIIGPTGSPIGDNVLLVANAGNGRVAALSDGGFVLTWSDVSNEQLLARTFDSAGQPIGGTILVREVRVGLFETCALPDGGFVVGWLDEATRRLWIKIHDADGQAVGGDILVDTLRAGYGIGSVVGLSDGTFIVQWSERAVPSTDYGVFTQRFDADGNRIGPEILFGKTAM